MFYALQTTTERATAETRLFAFDSRAARDAFVKFGHRHDWSLRRDIRTTYSAIPAKNAKTHAHVDGLGDAFAYHPDGGVIYLTA